MAKIKNKRGIISRAEVIRILGDCNRVSSPEHALKYQSIICFLYLSGVRISEALSLKRSDFWTDSKYLNIRVPLSKTGARKQNSLKIERILFFPLDLDEIKFFLAFIIRYIEAKNDEAGSLIWRLNRRTVYKFLQTLEIKVYPHLFRHTRASIFAEKNVTNSQARAWFGWAKSDMFDRYVHVSKASLMAMADKL